MTMMIYVTIVPKTYKFKIFDKFKSTMHNGKNQRSYRFMLAYRQHECRVHVKQTEGRYTIVVINLPHKHENLKKVNLHLMVIFKTATLVVLFLDY